MKLFLSMLISSNLLFLCFLLSIFLGGKYLSIRWKNAVLKLCLFLSIVPIAVLVNFIKSLMTRLMYPITNTPFTLSGQDPVLILSPTGFDMTLPLKNEVFTITTWLFIGLVIFIYRIWHYFAERKKIIKIMQPANDQVIDAILMKQANSLNLHCRVTLYINNMGVSPFTVGIWKPIIAVPSGLNLKELEMVLLHELCHIKNGDNVYGFLRLFTLSLYWFNPLSYLADYYIEKTSELCCDTKVVARNSNLDKSAYCHLILELASLNNENKQYEYSFSRHGKDVKERIMNIMKTKKTTIRSKVCSTILTGCIVLCSSIPVLAYQSPNAMEIQYENHAPVDLESNFTFEFQTDDIQVIDRILFDKQFIDANGRIYNADNLNSDERFGCDKHTYVSGTFTIHIDHGDSSCTVEYYRAKRCSKCGSTTVGDLYKTVDYVKCTH